MGIHRPSPMTLLQLAHCFTLRDLVEEVDGLLDTLFEGFRASNSLCLAMMGLVCERVGSLGGLLSTPVGRTSLVEERGEKLALVVVGDRGVSSNKVSIALSSGPTDLAVLLAPCPECEDEVAERLRTGIRAEYTDSDDFEDRDEGNWIPSFLGMLFPSS